MIRRIKDVLLRRPKIECFPGGGGGDKVVSNVVHSTPLYNIRLTPGSSLSKKILWSYVVPLSLLQK